MELADRLKPRAAVVNRIVTIPGSARDDGYHPQIGAADEYLGVAGPTVVLGFRGAGMITSRHQRAVHDPRLATIVIVDDVRQQRSKPRREVLDDPMNLRLRHPADTSDLTKREVCTQAHADHLNALAQTPSPRPAATALRLCPRAQRTNHGIELLSRETGRVLDAR